MITRKERTGLPLILMGLLLLVLLPALLYSAYEFATLSESEGLVAEVYRRQLDGVLFSLNQYSWDVANGWASSVNGAIAEHAGSPVETLDRQLATVIERSAGLKSVILCDTLGTRRRYISPEMLRATEAAGATLPSAHALLGRLVELRRMEYRKLEPLPLPSGEGQGREVLIAFATGSDRPEEAIGVLLLNDSLFAHQVLGPRIREAAGTDFLLAVLRSGARAPTLATAPVNPEEIRQRRALWLFPELSLGIRLAGESIDEIARSRFRKNILFILGLDAILIAAVVFVYRAFRREMEFARMKSDFVSTVSHELRTPLALIRMYAETLEMGRLTDPARKQQYLATIVRETERLGRLVTNILNFSRIEAGRMPYRFSRADLNGIVREVVDRYADHLREKGFEPALGLEADLPPVRADAEAVQEALINLIDNGMKYSTAETYMRIATGRLHGMAYVDVEDHGIGIHRKHQEKVFEMFYRITDGLVQTTRGSGLGLPLVRHIMRAHGGDVTLTSAPGAGSTFRLLFPLFREEGPQSDRTGDSG